MSLTAQQKAAVAHDGNLLLQACPGSGKTRTIVQRLIKDIEGIRETPFAVACITYTNAAVQELEHRISSDLQPGDERHYVISTIHAFCLNEILRPFAFRIPGFNGSMKVLTRDRAEFQEIAEYAADAVGWHNLNYWDFEGFAGLNLGVNGELIGTALNNEPLKAAAPIFWSRASDLGFIDFANIIYKTYCLLRDQPEVVRTVATRFRAFLLDEFQDTTELQIEILKLIYLEHRSRFFIVGDPAQSIFGFTGARPELIDPFAAFIKARTDIVLSSNFRSNPQIVADANRLFKRIPAMTSEGKTRLCTQQTVYHRVNGTFPAITDNFLPLLTDLGIPYGKTAILARNWTPLFPLSRKLREFGVPVVGPGARPYRRSRLFATLAEQLCGAIIDRASFNIRQLERAIFFAVQDITAKPRAEIFSYEGRVVVVQLIRKASALAEQLGAIDWLEQMSEVTGKILAGVGWIDQGQIMSFRYSVEEMKQDMIQSNIDLPNLGIEDLGLFASPSKAMRLMTVHNSKGLEFDAVAFINLRERTLPDYRAVGPAEIADEKRLFYVGVTRAKRLLMYISEIDNWNNAPTRFLNANGVGKI
ncbi:ATP-dependent helicase [Ciceribacter sichuanensis]|nr:ATP-dependent helicase [Ciceribacter sp. S101]